MSYYNRYERDYGESPRYKPEKMDRERYLNHADSECWHKAQVKRRERNREAEIVNLQKQIEEQKHQLNILTKEKELKIASNCVV